MIEIYCAVVAIFVLFVVGRGHGILNIVDPVVYFALTNIIFGLVGVLYRSSYEHVAYIDDAAAVILMNGMLVFGVSVLIGNFIFSGRKKAARIARVKLRNVGFGAYIAAFAVGAIFMAAYVVKTGGLLWSGFGFEDERIIERQGFGWLVLAGTALLTVSTWLIIISMLSTGRVRWWGWGLVVVSGAFLLIPGNRGPAAEMLVGVAFFYCVARWGRLPIHIFIGGLLILFGFITFLGLIRAGDVMEVEMLMAKGLWRPYVNIYNFQTVFDAFPLYLPYQYGYGFIQDVSVILPGYQPNFGLWLKESLNIEFAGGSITVGFAGEMYSNFGEVGVYVGYFAIGLMLVWLSVFLRRFVGDVGFAFRYAVAASVKAVAVSGVVSPILYIFTPFAFCFLVLALMGGAARRAYRSAGL